ncbi:MAG: type II toxin-antitoxin system PemK/MazF family toxin [Defluviitaleaceae bacterium]|nr:type II toxin-antitoxin system PemK/MazF family toxin [Defluviitaleaceae bacterium]
MRKYQRRYDVSKSTHKKPNYVIPEYTILDPITAIYKRGDIYFADIPKTIGSSQCGVRPVLVLQNNIGNHYAPTVIVAIITSTDKKPHMPTHAYINQRDIKFENMRSFDRFETSVVQFEQVHTLDKSVFRHKVGYIRSLNKAGNKFNRALMASLGLCPEFNRFVLAKGF